MVYSEGPKPAVAPSRACVVSCGPWDLPEDTEAERAPEAGLLLNVAGPLQPCLRHTSCQPRRHRGRSRAVAMAPGSVATTQPPHALGWAGRLGRLACLMLSGWSVTRDPLGSAF